MIGEMFKDGAGRLAAATGAGTLVFVLSQAWVSSVEREVAALRNEAIAAQENALEVSRRIRTCELLVDRVKRLEREVYSGDG